MSHQTLGFHLPARGNNTPVNHGENALRIREDVAEATQQIEDRRDFAAPTNAEALEAGSLKIHRALDSASKRISDQMKFREGR